MPLISVVIPTYNSGQFIRKTLQSVINQTYGNWEILITDDCSQDNTVQVVREIMQNEKRIKLFEQRENQGPARARNIGIKHARGKYIAFLDADDSWLSEKLQIQTRFMEEQGLGISFTDYYLLNEHSDSKKKFQSLLSEVNYTDIVRFNYIACSTVMYNQDSLGKHFMPDIRNRQDWGLWIKLIKIAGTAVRISQPLTNYLLREDSISSNKLNLVKYHWYIYRRFLRFSLLKSLLYLSRNIFMHLKNRRK